MAELRDAPLSVDEVRGAVMDPGAGGIALFAGAVRNHDHGRDVVRLSYSAHPSAASELRRVGEEVAAEFGVSALAAVHRVGELAVGDLAVVGAVSCPHRAEAFAACRALIDELKRRGPVWKQQLFSGGESEWVNSAWGPPDVAGPDVPPSSDAARRRHRGGCVGCRRGGAAGALRDPRPRTDTQHAGADVGRPRDPY